MEHASDNKDWIMSVRQENKVDKVIILRWLEYRTFLLVKITDITVTFLFCQMKVF